MATIEGEGDFDIYFKNTSAIPILWMSGEGGTSAWAWGPSSPSGGSLLEPKVGAMSGPARWNDWARDGYYNYVFATKDDVGLIEITFNLLPSEPADGYFVKNWHRTDRPDTWTNVVVRVIDPTGKYYSVVIGTDQTSKRGSITVSYNDT